MSAVPPQRASILVIGGLGFRNENPDQECTGAGDRGYNRDTLDEELLSQGTEMIAPPALT
jgi:hypothetical protein